MPTPRTKPFRPAMLSLEVRLMLDASSTPAPTVPDLPAHAAGITPTELASYYQTGQIAIKPAAGTSTVELGKGETVVLIEEDYDPLYLDSDDPNWSTSTLALSSRAMGLPSNAAGTNADFQFTMVDANGLTNLAAETGTDPGQLTATSQNSGEFALDIQAVHAIAPYANIDVVVIPNLFKGSIDAGIAEALKLDPAAISMSFSGSEHKAAEDAPFVDNNGVTYIMSAGDDGASYQYVGVKPTPTAGTGEGTTTAAAADQADQVEAQAAKTGHHAGKKHKGHSSSTAKSGHHAAKKHQGQSSTTTATAKGSNTQYLSKYLPMAAVASNEVMVGGTSMTTSHGAVTGEVVWGHGKFSDRIKSVPGTHGGTGGGISKYNPRPEYQQTSAAVQAFQENSPTSDPTKRLGPDISMMSMPGIEVLRFGLTKKELNATPTNPGHYYWFDDGGTSLSAPLFAGLMAIVAQGRSQEGLPQLSSLDTLNFLYHAPAADFNDITSGNNGYKAQPGFDLASGLGTPKAALINDLITATYATTTTLTATNQALADGAQTTLTAQVVASPGTRVPGGSVDFYDGTTLLQSVPLDNTGQAIFAFDSSDGTHQFTARYTASGLFAGSSDTATAEVGGSTAPASTLVSTTTLRTPSSNWLAADVPITLTATVATSEGTTPPGSVSFTDDGQAVGTATVGADGRAAVVYTPTGTGVHSLIATYGGATGVVGSSSPTAAVLVMATPTTTTLTVVPTDDAGSDPQYTLTATVAAGTTPVGGGTVEFLDNSQVVAQASLDQNGRAVATTQLGTTGTDQLVAVFKGATPYAASQSAVKTVQAGNLPSADLAAAFATSRGASVRG